MTLLDLVEVELGYSIVTNEFYERVPVPIVLKGARDGIVTYLRAHGVANPIVGMPHAAPDGRGAVPAIEQQIGRAIVRYGSHIVTRDLIYATIRGEVAALHDPYAVFFTKAEVARFSQALDGTGFGGIGAAIGRDDTANSWHIKEVFAGSPAARAGLLPDDVITAIDGRALDDPTAELAGARLRGTVGSRVRLSIVRAGAALPAPIVVTRAIVTPPATTQRMLADRIGYVALRSFDATAGDEVNAALRTLSAKGARAFVFDLRDNGGGYESAAAAVASRFIAKGPIVIIQDKHGKRRTTVADGKPATARPLVVLVNANSASGSELAAGAIQDAKRGTIVGVKTFGKGVVQTIVPLPDGAAIKLTSARYFTAHGRDIEKVGLTPDVTVVQPDGARFGVPGSDPQLDRALAILGAPSRTASMPPSAIAQPSGTPVPTSPPQERERRSPTSGK